MSKEKVQPETAVLDTFVEGKPFTIRGDYEAVADQLPNADKYVAGLMETAPVAVIQPAPAVPNTKPAYEDFNTLGRSEVLRRKISAWAYDRKNGTTMLDLLNERIADDRNVAMAQRLGLITTVHCAKHEKVVAKLKQLV
jgi:hypothetical protein